VGKEFRRARMANVAWIIRRAQHSQRRATQNGSGMNAFQPIAFASRKPSLSSATVERPVRAQPGRL